MLRLDFLQGQNHHAALPGCVQRDRITQMGLPERTRVESLGRFVKSGSTVVSRSEEVGAWWNELSKLVPMRPNLSGEPFDFDLEGSWRRSTKRTMSIRAPSAWKSIFRWR